MHLTNTAVNDQSSAVRVAAGRSIFTIMQHHKAINNYARKIAEEIFPVPTEDVGFSAKYLVAASCALLNSTDQETRQLAIWGMRDGLSDTAFRKSWKVDLSERDLMRLAAGELERIARYDPNVKVRIAARQLLDKAR